VPEGRWTQGASLDGKGQYQPMISEPLGEEPQLARPRSDSGAQTDQMGMGSATAAAANDLLSGGGTSAAE
jgi:Mn-containing catalase